MKTLSVVFSALLLAACGGGGGGDTTTTPPITASTPFLDSFGGDASGSGFGGGDAGADGSAGDGAPIVGGTVLFTDAAGKTVSATTDAKGYYRVKINGFTPPFVVKVTKPDGKFRYSLNVKPLKINGFVTVNITGLTEKIASDVAVAGGKTGASQLTPQIVSANSSVIETSIQSLRTQLAGVLGSAGLSATTFDPLSMPFVPDRTGYDYVLDNIVVALNSSGASTVVIAPTYVPQTNVSKVTALSGSWQQSMHYVSWSLPSPLPADPASTTVLGANVPASVAFTNNWITSLAPQTTTSSGITTTITWVVTAANAYRMTMVSTGIDTNYTQTVDYTFTNFSGCGECGVGTQVSYTMNFIMNSATGTINGNPIQATTPTTAVVTNTFKRLS